MPSLSRRSRAVLDTCIHKIVMVAERVIRFRDFTVLPDGGARTPDRQGELMGTGSSKVKDPLRSRHVPKDKDGKYDPKGKAAAIDIMPVFKENNYRVDWRTDKKLLNIIEEYTKKKIELSWWRQEQHELQQVKDLKNEIKKLENDIKDILENIKRIYNFNGYFQGTADSMGIPLTNGNDWDRDGMFDDHSFLDSPHWQSKIKY